LLDPRALAYARTWAHDANSYVVQGEYARVLGDFLEVFPRDRLHIIYSHDLRTRPAETLRAVLRFLGVDERYEPEAPSSPSATNGTPVRLSEADITAVLADVVVAPPGRRAAAVGERLRDRVEPEGLEQLLTEVRRYEQAYIEADRSLRNGLRFYLEKIWNTRSGPPEPIPQRTRERLIAHYEPEIPLLAELVGMRPPWADAWGC
jgi:hypothetical protein